MTNDERDEAMNGDAMNDGDGGGATMDGDDDGGGGGDESA